MTDERWEKLMREVEGLLDRTDLDGAHRLLTDMVQKQVRERGEDDPGIATARVMLAHVCDELGRNQEAQALMAAAEANLLRAGETALLIDCLAWRAGKLMENRNHAAAERLYRHCLELAENDAAVPPAYALQCCQQLAGALLHLGKRDGASELLEQAAQADEPQDSSEMLLAAGISVLLGELRLGDGHLPEAQIALNRAMELYEQVPDVQGAELARLHCDLGRLALAESRLTIAEKQFAQAITLAGDVAGDGGIAFGAHYGLGLVRRSQRRHAEARQILQQALDAAQKTEISDLSLLQSCLANLGRVCLELHLYEEAETHLARALALAQRSGHAAEAETKSLGQDLARARQSKAMLPQSHGLRDVDGILHDLRCQRGEAALKNPRYALRLMQEGIEQNKHGRWERVAWCHQAAQRVFENAFGHEHEAVADCLHGQARGLLEQGLWEQAEQAVRESLAILRRINRPGQVSSSMMLNTLGAVLLSREQYVEAGAVLREAVAGFEAAGAPDDAAISMMNLAIVCKSAEGRGDEAEGWFLRALGILDRPEHSGQPNPRLASHLEQLSSFYLSRGDYEKAEAVLKRAVEVAIAALGEQDPLVSHFRRQHESMVRQLAKLRH